MNLRENQQSSSLLNPPVVLESREEGRKKERREGRRKEGRKGDGGRKEGKKEKEGQTEPGRKECSECEIKLLQLLKKCVFTYVKLWNKAR